MDVELRKHSSQGFTMAELLIVVAIIAVLVAIAIPVFTTQLKNSRLAVDHAAMRDAYALMQIANNTQEVEIGGTVYSFEELRDLSSKDIQGRNFYLTEDCSGFVFQGGAGPSALPQGAYAFKETGCEAESPYKCEICAHFSDAVGFWHYKGAGIMLTLDEANNRITFAS